MQQASSSIGKIVSTAGNNLPPAAASPRFVVNLCASTTPVGLVQPSHTGLKRFTFFVSRRLEEGRERFRLHMGYFDSQEEAEKILDLVRDVYPAAWAGVAPGIKLRARGAATEVAAAAAPATDTVAAVPAPAVVPVAVVETALAATAAAAPVPATLQLELVPDLPRATPAAAAATEALIHGATRSLSEVRATIDSLDDTAPAPTVEVAPVPVAPALEGAAVLRMLESSRPAPAARMAPLAPMAMPARPAVAPAPVAVAPRAEPALFAVQLLWSVQPINMSAVPQLAIFSAYTLYGAEGNRDGRRWYGLRLGFFTDAVSAKQVAQYVRSEFTSVSVVPVTVRERARASGATAKPLPTISTAKHTGPELNFIEDVHTDTATSGSRPALQLPEAAAGEITPAVRAAMAAVGVSSRAMPGKRAKLRVAQGTKPVSKRPTHNRPLSLEETLEILGAGELQVDNGRGELLNDGSRLDRKKPAPGGSRFSRLINRLADRLGNS